MKKIFIALVLPCLALVGCEKLSPAVRVQDTRIVGGEVSVEGDPTRASPMAGETMNIRLYVASPVGVNDTLNWAFYTCLQSLSAGGLPKCEGDFSLENVSMGSGTPMFSVVTPTPNEPPPDLTTSNKPTVLVNGIVCINGMPSLDATTMQASCGEGATRTFPLVMRVPIQTDAASTNHNPTFGDVIHRGETLWPENSADGVTATGCASMPDTPELPHVSRGMGEPMVVNFVMLDASNAELISTNADTGAMTLETLQINMTATAGDSDGSPFEVLDGDAIPERFDIRWTPPETVSSSGELVKFWFVMRDGRNGSTITQRAICLLP